MAGTPGCVSLPLGGDGGGGEGRSPSPCRTTASLTPTPPIRESSRPTSQTTPCGSVSWRRSPAPHGALSGGVSRYSLRVSSRRKRKPPRQIPYSIVCRYRPRARTLSAPHRSRISHDQVNHGLHHVGIGLGKRKGSDRIPQGYLSPATHTPNETRLWDTKYRNFFGLCHSNTPEGRRPTGAPTSPVVLRGLDRTEPTTTRQ